MRYNNCMEKNNYNKGIGHAEHYIILHMLCDKLMDEEENPYDTVLGYIDTFDLKFHSETTGNRNHSNDYYDEIEYVYQVTEDIGISFWWIECIPDNETIVENWEFDETLVKIVKPVKVERIEWQPVITE